MGSGGVRVQDVSYTEVGASLIREDYLQMELPEAM